MLKPLTQDFRLRPPEIMVPHPQQSRHHDNKNNLLTGSLPPPLTTSHSADAHYCPICGQGFIRSNLLAEHMHLCHQTEMLFPMDTTTVDYPCQQCDETFRTTLELEDHIRNAHQMLRFSRCTACGLFGMSIANGEYKCIHCGTISTPLGHNFYPSTIGGGVSSSATPSSSSLTGTNSKLPPFSVKLTKQKTNHQQNSNSNNNSGGSGGSNRSENNNAVVINGSGPIPLPIKVEIKTEPQQNYYPTQQNSGSTTTTSNKRHKCPDCEKTFKTSGTLSVHRRIHIGEAEIHTKERPYSCSYCSKTFTQSNTLKQHTRIHTGEKPFHCIYCEKAFSVKDYLTKHIRTHTGEKPYTCTFCDKRFTQRSALTVHTTKLHPI